MFNNKQNNFFSHIFHVFFSVSKTQKIFFGSVGPLRMLGACEPVAIQFASRRIQRDVGCRHLVLSFIVAFVFSSWLQLLFSILYIIIIMIMVEPKDIIFYFELNDEYIEYCLLYIITSRRLALFFFFVFFFFDC